MWQAGEIRKLEQRVGKVYNLVASDTKRKLTDEIAKDLTYEELVETLRSVREFIDSELFLQGE